MRKIMLIALTVTLLGATAFSQVNLAGQNNTNWRVYNIMPATSKLWDINPAQATSSGGLQFPIQQFLTTTTGSFVVYLSANYNKNITGKTFYTAASWTSGTYVTRGAASDGAFVRFWFQDVTSGPYGASDYWFSTGTNSLDMNAVTGGTLSVALTDPTLWTNLCGQRADDTATYSGPDCVGGTYSSVTPAAGFANAMKNVKQLGLVFGRGSSYASGVAHIDSPGIFTVSTFTIN
jgi:hypothetical protein